MKNTKANGLRMVMIAGLAMFATAASAQTLPTASTLPVPAPERLLTMIRANVLAVGQANEAGNYEVLRALASAKFRALNSQDGLAKTFAAVRALHLDVSPVVVTTPVLTDPPSITTEGYLRIYGAFPTSPIEVPFGMLFEVEGGTWKLNAISMGARPAAKVADATMPLLEPVAAAPVKSEAKSEKKSDSKKK
ncbi:MAG: hypothetical protein ABL901_12085 [Hyphomicrobiaceae bacterium]